MKNLCEECTEEEAMQLDADPAECVRCGGAVWEAPDLDLPTSDSAARIVSEALADWETLTELQRVNRVAFALHRTAMNVRSLEDIAWIGNQLIRGFQSAG